ncbi:hypothetical protein [Psychromonas sp. Urea-02u-13]|uniref:hypothetical protein n=1 Tax=Psychromonas sp. Urea-02u-13 TaxID=2058326 RepID=UPI000C32C337|nr:hypothetical protein [Psychromonas sp. Urea-02u-13]PKG37639.1 hypothetical protein CXF74_17855 [Psychromonas sp. Urea-02u-13]
MDDNEIKKYKKSDKIFNPTDLRQSKTIKFRKNKKPSIDVKYETQLTTAEQKQALYQKHGEKNDDGSYSMGSNLQSINQYTNRLLEILKGLNLPTDVNVAYRQDGTTVPVGEGMALGVYLYEKKFANVPNVNRIGWLLNLFYNIKIYINKGDFENACNQLIEAISQYSDIILISIEGDIVPHETQRATRERKKGKENRVLEAKRQADELRKSRPNISISEMAKIIGPKMGVAASTVRQRYLSGY